MRKLVLLSMIVIGIIGCTEPVTKTVIEKEQAVEYKVSFNPNGAEGTMDDITVKAGEFVILPKNTFTRNNYKFMGWSTTADGEVIILNSGIYGGLHSDAMLYAVWGAKNEYKIKFNANGGIGFMATQTAVADSSIKLSANAFTREGYIFEGWAEKAGDLKKYDNQAEIILNNETELYAVWKPIAYTIKFDSNLDKSFAVENPKDINATYDEEITLPVLSDIDKHYYFQGWNTEKLGNGSNYTVGTKVKNLKTANNETLQLYARWKSAGEYFINYELDGGTNNEKNPSSFYKADEVKLYEPKPPIDECTFEGWYDNKSFSGAKITGWAAGSRTSDVTLYAKWNKPSYKVTLISKIGNDTVSVSVDAVYGNSMPKISIPFRDLEHKFGGYFTQENGLGKQYYAADGESIVKYDEKSNLTLYAFWIKQTCRYEITLVAEDGVSSNVGVIVPVVYNENLPDITPLSNRNDNKYYVYCGYFTERNGMGERYYAADGKGLKKYDLHKDLTLYAKWGNSALNALQIIKNMSKGEIKTVDVCGEVTDSDIEAIKNALNDNETIKVALDLSEAAITVLADNAFKDCTNLTGIVISDSVTSIGKSAFYGCSALTNVVIGNGVTEIGDTYTFNGCDNVQTLVTGNGLTSLKNLPIKSALKSITIGSSVTNIKNELAHAGSLTSLTVDENNTAYKSNENYVYTKDGKTLVAAPKDVVNAVIPDDITKIGDNAFCDCTNLTNITIPNTVTEIGFSSFSGCSSLTSVTIPDSVTEIGSHIFQKCSKLASVVISSRVTKITYSMFDGCSNLASVTIPDSVTEITDWAFSECSNLINVTIPKNVTRIGVSAFSKCDSLTDVVFSDPNNWHNTTNDYYINGNPINVSNAKTNANNLKNSYRDYYWYKK